MASAGRILIIPKDNWNAETTYENLDLVFHNGTSWLARKDVIGIEPSDDNSEYWFKMCEAVDLGEYVKKSEIDSIVEAKIKEYMENNTTE